MPISQIKFDLHILNPDIFILLADLCHTFPIVSHRIIRTGDEKRPELQALYKALCSDKIKEFMKTKYEGAVLATH